MKDINSQIRLSRNRLPPLFRVAAKKGLKETVMLHLRLGADLNATDENGRSPLVLASAGGHVEICHILLEAGADPTLRDDEGNDALSVAIKNGQKEVEAILRLHVPIFQAELVSSDNVPVDTGVFFNTPGIKDPVFFVNRTIEMRLDDNAIDLSLWEEDLELPPPPNNPSCHSNAKEIQYRMSHHDPISTDEDWSEINIELPEFFSSRRRRAFDNDEKWFIYAREIILTGLRDGFVTEHQIVNAASSEKEDHQLSDVEFEAALRIVLGEIGIFMDNVPDALPLDPLKEDDEDDFYDDQDNIIADEAINFLNNLLSDINAPLTIYYRDVGKCKKISREDEIVLAHEIKAGTRDILEAIIRSPVVVDEILKCAERIVHGDAPIQSMISCSMINETDQLAEHINLVNDTEAQEEEIQEQDIDEENGVYLGDQLAPDAPANCIDILSSIRNLNDKISKRPLSHEFNDLFIILKDKIMSLGLSYEFVSRLWRIVERNEPDNEVRRCVERGMARVHAAKSKFAESNLRLVLWLAKKYKGLPYMDLVQEGNIGLLKAIDRFDPFNGAKFSTYAIWWIRQSIQRAVANKQNLIRLPVHMLESIRKVENASEALILLEGRLPDTDELANMLDLPISKIQRILTVSDDPISIDMLTDEGLPLGECVEDKIMPNPEEAVLQAVMVNTIREAMKSLKKIEAKVIRLRFGMDGDRDHTLEEIGQMYGVTRERIRQIEKKALCRLGHPSRAMELRCFLN